MKQKLLAAAGLAALLAAPASAVAQDSGFYLRGQAGYGTHTDIEISGEINGEVESEGNGTASLGAGYAFGNGWRLEGDVASLWTDLGKVSSFPGTYAKLRTNTAMLNALYDFNDFGNFQPYVGGGIGLVRGEAKVVANDFLAEPIVGPQIANPALAGQSIAASFDDGDTGFGWQLLAGVGYAITDNLTWDTSYRYMQSTDLDLEGAVARVTPGVTSAGLVTLEDVGAHSLMTGFRYRFGDSAPKTKVCPNGAVIPVDDICPPVIEYKTCPDGSRVEVGMECPVVIEYKDCWDGSRVEVTEACPVQMYTCPDGTEVTDLNLCTRVGELPACDRNVTEIIYYEFDRGQSPETEATINRILDRADFCDVDNFLVVGHTDTSGSASYNLALSRRRAADARTELIEQGVPEGIIRSEGRGETQPAVATGDGVREQLNRRTEVVMTLASQGVDVDSFRVMPSMTTSTTTTTTVIDSSAVFTDSEGRRMRQNADGSFSYIE